MGEQELKGVKKHICMGLLAHVDAGKTTLSEGILYLTGAIRRLGRVDNRDAFLDTYHLERDRGITIFSKQAVFDLGDTRVTLLDTPGHVDFSAEMERTLQVLDYAVLVISGADGVQGHTRTLWRLLKRYGIPVFLFINKMDQNGTDREERMRELQDTLSEGCLDFAAITGDVPSEAEREALWESLAMCDEALLERYLETGRLEKQDIRRLIRERRVFPCCFGSALKLTGVAELLRVLEEYMECPAWPSEFGARVYKISRDEQGNRMTHMKLTGGRLRARDLLPSGDGGAGEKVTQLRIYSGARYEAVAEVEAGMVCAVLGPAATWAGQGLGRERKAWQPLLEPVLTYGVIPPQGCDLTKLLGSLRQLEEEDPQLRILWNETAGEIQVQVMGDVQIEILRSLIQERFGISVAFGTGAIVYKETILAPVEGVGHFEPLRHYAEVHLLLEPGPAGSGIQLDTSCSEDSLDGSWQRLILTHLAERRHPGVLTGSEITDMKITLIAGKAHLKHTEGGDFRQATYRAVRQGLKEAQCRLLEPFYEFRLELPPENLGRAMSDVERMKGSFEPPCQEGEASVLTGKAPVSEMRAYQREVAAYTRGQGRLYLSLRGYEPCHNEAEVIQSFGYDSEADTANPTGSIFCAHGAGYFVPWDQVKAHMHAASPLGGGEGEKAPEPAAEPARSRPETPSSRAGGSWTDDKELEAIFHRRFGAPKRRTPGGDGPRLVTASEKKRPEASLNERHVGERAEKPAEPLMEDPNEYLLVDGYNIIFAWDELRELSERSIEGARTRLMDILCNYQGYRRCTLLVVFDAYKVTGGTGEAIDYHNIHVIYTKEAETADQYIEKLAHKIGRSRNVTVATSDGLEQLIIYGQGCRLLSARELKKEIDEVSRQIAEQITEHRKRQRGGKTYLLDDTEEQLSAYLEQIRRKDR